jgi:hypothetical protein
MNPETAAVFAMLFTGMMLAGVVLILRGPVGRALARRIDGTAGQSEGLSPAEADELRNRVVELEQQQSRVLELEERLDFAERLLAQQHEPVKLPDPRAER